MDQQQADYLRKREAQERAAMAPAAGPDAIKVHGDLAQRYAVLAQRVGAEYEVNGEASDV